MESMTAVALCDSRSTGIVADFAVRNRTVANWRVAMPAAIHAAHVADLAYAAKRHNADAAKAAAPAKFGHTFGHGNATVKQTGELSPPRGTPR